jgi:uncharacterized membrane protein YdfJ with MMPL/SSD domain
VARLIASVATRAPRAILVAIVVVTVALGVWASMVPERLGLGGEAPSGSQSAEVADDIAAELGYEASAAYVVLLSAEEPITSPASRVSIETVRSQIESIDGVGGLVEGAPSEDSSSTTLGVHMETGASSAEIADAGETIADDLDPGGLSVGVSGPAAVGEGARDTVLDEAPALVLLALPLLLLILAGALGVRAAFATLLAAVVAIVASVAIVGIVDLIVTVDAIALAAAIPLAAVLGAESAATLLSRYREESATLGAGSEALEYSLHVVLRGAGIALFSAALIGLALFAVPIDWLRSLGAGIVVAALLAPLAAIKTMAATIGLKPEAHTGEALPLVAEGGTPEKASWLFRLLLSLGRGRARGLVALIPLLVVAALALPLRDDAEAVGLNGYELPSDSAAAEASDQLAVAFGPGAGSPLTVVTEGPAEAPTVTLLRDAISQKPGVATVGLGVTAGSMATFEVETDSVPGSLDSQTTTEEVRAVPSPSPQKVGGGDAVLVDSADRLSDDLPLVALIALLGTAALWSFLFRSAFGPLLALAAAIAPLAGLAAVQAVFGEGRLTDLLDYAPTGGIHLETYAVVGATLLAIGLARGAQLATALREERLLGGGVAGSLARAGVLTASPAATASVLGIALVGVWLGSDLLPAQEIGLGLAVGLLADLLLVRLLIAPALARLAI